MKRIIALLLTCMLAVTMLAACGGSKVDTASTGGETPNGNATSNDSAAPADTADSGLAADDGRKYVIGVIPFSDTAAEQIEWNNYLNNYVSKAFNIDFKFVPAPGMDAASAVSAVEELKLAGAQGILGIVDTPAAIEKANELELWYVRPSGLSVMADYEAVKDLPYYLGTMGPALDDEYAAAYNAAKYFVENGSKDILVYGALLGLGFPSDMHGYRFNGFKDALEELGAVYTTPDANVFVDGPGAFESGTSGLNITVIHGINGAEYLDPGFNDRFTQAVSGKNFDTVLIGAEGSQDVNTLLGNAGITGAKMSEVGAFTPVAEASFNAGILQYLVGKYPSSVGPAVVALMNAIDGNADIVKNADGTGARMEGPFWTAESKDKFVEMNALDDVANPAFNRALMEQYVKRLNPNVTHDDFVKFAAMGYDELKAAHQ